MPSSPTFEYIQIGPTLWEVWDGSDLVCDEFRDERQAVLVPPALLEQAVGL